MSRNRAAERESKESNVVKKTTLQCPQLKLLTASRTCELGTHEGAHEFPGAAETMPSLKSGHRGFLGVRGDPCPSLPQAAGGVGSSSFLWQHLPSLGLLFLSQISLSLTLFFFFPLSSAPWPADQISATAAICTKAVAMLGQILHTLCGTGERTTGPLHHSGNSTSASLLRGTLVTGVRAQQIIRGGLGSQDP